MQRRKQVVRIDGSVRIRHISHALLLDQMALAGQQSQDARDDLAEQRLELFARERRCDMRTDHRTLIGVVILGRAALFRGYSTDCDPKLLGNAALD